MQYNPTKRIKLSDLLCLFLKLVRPWHCNPLFAFSKIDMRPDNFKISNKNGRYKKAFHHTGLVRWIIKGMLNGGVILFKGLYNSKNWIAKKKKFLQLTKEQKIEIRQKEQSQNQKVDKRKNLLQEFDNSLYQKQLLSKTKFVGDPSLFCYYLLSQQQENFKNSPFDKEKYLEFAKKQSVYLSQELYIIVLRKILLQKQYNLHEVEFLSMMASILEPQRSQDTYGITQNNNYFIRSNPIDQNNDCYILDNKISISEMMNPVMRFDSPHQFCFKQMEKYIPRNGLIQESRLGFEFKDDLGRYQGHQIQELGQDSKIIDDKQNNNDNNNNNFNILNIKKQQHFRKSSNVLNSYSSILKKEDHIVVLQIINQLYQIKQYNIERLVMSIGAKITKQSIHQTRKFVDQTMKKLMKIYGVVNLRDLNRTLDSRKQLKSSEIMRQIQDQPKLRRFPSFQDGADFELEQSNNNRGLRNLDNQEVLRIQKILERKGQIINSREINKKQKIDLNQLSPIARAQYDDQKWREDLDRKENQCVYQVVRRCSFICDALCRRDSINSEQDEWKRFKRHPHTNLRFLANVSNLGLICLILAIGLFVLEFIV